MSKTKTKRARRELKRDANRKIAAHHRKAAKASDSVSKPSTAASTSKSTPGKKATTNTSKPNTMPSKAPAQDVSTEKPHIQASQRKPVPFGTYEHILLVGEGDFSFTRSLAIEHGCANVVGTSYDTESEVREKYPEFALIQSELNDLAPPVPLHFEVDATKLGGYKQLRCKREEGEDEEDDEASKSKEGWDTIAFMFPHIGGLSTDVNRQVRSNQALLVSFFQSVLDAPTPAKRLAVLSSQRRKNRPNLVEAHPQKAEQKPFLRMGGRVIVTLFEGEPYTLWNIRDLARHAGLKVVESWKFDWEQYPGYHHVRTLGAVESGWQGEDRDARMFVFEKVPLVADSDEEKELEKLGFSAKKRKGPAGGQRERKVKRVKGESSDEED